jgi:uncharacterized protein YbjT (DUF2867 family)
MIVITTPTGLIGRQVLENVLNGDKPVRVIVRDANKLPAEVRDRVEIVEGSHDDPSVIEKAFAGAETLFWVSPADHTAPSVDAAYVDFSRPAVEALKNHAIKRVVTISALGRDVALDSGYVGASLRMEDLIASTGVNLRALTMPSFMDNMINQAGAIKDQGMFFSTISADRKNPTVATRDIAAIAARLLLDDSWSGQETVPVLGPEDLSNNDIAQIISDVLGTHVSFQQIPSEAFKARLTGFGMSDAMAQGMIDMNAAKDNGLDNSVLRTPENSTPTSFRQWAEEVLQPAVQG